MNLYDHCNLCDNQKTNLQYGVLCGLTDKKPEFSNTCSKIEFGKKIEEKLSLIHIEIESLKKKRTSIYISSSFNLIIGSILVLSQKKVFTEYNFTYSSYVNTFLGSLIIIFIGISLIGVGYEMLGRYLKKVKNIENEKNHIDTILNKYQVKYNCNVIFGEKYHGNQDVQVELKSDSDLLKNSNTIFHL